MTRYKVKMQLIKEVVQDVWFIVPAESPQQAADLVKAEVRAEFPGWRDYFLMRTTEVGNQ